MNKMKMGKVLTFTTKEDASGNNFLFQLLGVKSITVVPGGSPMLAEMEKVAEKLRSVARNKQVLCVTHLPQIAAMGDTHMLIAKSERDGRTYTTVTPLDHDGRTREVARIIGGASITETTLKSAEEMLSH